MKFTPILLLFLCSSCMNPCEKEIVGIYTVEGYVAVDSTTVADLPKLILTSDKKFSLTAEHRTVTGNWRAKDWGDFSLGYLSTDDKNWEECWIVSDSNIGITFYSPYTALFPNFKKITFVKDEIISP